MIELFVGIIILLLTTPKEEEQRQDNNNDEIIRPILMEDFHNDFEDFGE